MRRLGGFARSLGLRPWQLVAIFALLLLLSQAMALALLSGPLLIMHIFDGVLETRNLSTFVVLIVMFLVAQLLVMVVRMLRQGIVHAVVAVVERKLFLATLRVSVRLAREGQPEQATSVLADFSVLRRFLSSSAITDVMGLVALPVPLYFLFMLHPWLGWLALAGCLTVGGFSVVTERLGRAAVRHSTILGNRATSNLSRHLQRRDEVEGLGLIPGIVRHWFPLRRETLALQQSARSRAEVLATISSAVALVTVCAVAALSAWLAIHHLAAPAIFAASFHVVARLLGPCESAAQNWTRWSVALVSFGNLQAILASLRRAPNAPPLGDATELRILGLRLEVPGSQPAADLTVEPGIAKLLVDDLHLVAPPGTLVAITGRNAAGKSSFLRALIGLAAPAKGMVMFRGAVLHEVERSVIGPHIGFLAQRSQLLRGSILDNINRLSGDAEGAIRSARLAGAHDMISRLPAGYSTTTEAGLSGGQQRQVALARALYGDPALVVLDEPEVGLDAPAMASLVAAVAQIRLRGAIVFLVTHDLNRWDGIADLELRLQGRGAWSTHMLHRQSLLQVVT